MIKWKLPKMEQWLMLLKRYKYVLIVAMAGVVLLFWPTGDKTVSKPVSGLTGAEEDFSVEALEERLGKTLSKIAGAGEVSVILTVRSGMERILASDTSADQRENQRGIEEQIVVISTDAGEEVVLIGQRYPTFQGALIVCPGGDNPEVRLQLTRAVAALTGLGSDRITVCKGS